MNQERPAENYPRPDGIEVLQREDDGDFPGEGGDDDADAEDLDITIDDESDDLDDDSAKVG